MLTQKEMTGAPTPATTTLTGLSLMNRPSTQECTTVSQKKQVVDKRSSLTARVLDLADWVLEQERRCRAAALVADNDQKRKALLRQAEAWAAGRLELLELAALKEGGR